VRKLAVVGLVLALLAVGAWWTAQPRTAQQAVGWCTGRGGDEVKFIRCLPWQSGDRVVGSSPLLVDLVGEPPFGPFCPPETDEWVRAPFRSGNPWLCLDTVPADGNTGGIRLTR
jgi:hypothetical protein